MTIDEATQILNIQKGAFKEESELQKMLKVRLFLFTFLIISRESSSYCCCWGCCWVRE
jgi:hypothetical protein